MTVSQAWSRETARRLKEGDQGTQVAGSERTRALAAIVQSDCILSEVGKPWGLKKEVTGSSLILCRKLSSLGSGWSFQEKKLLHSTYPRC